MRIVHAADLHLGLRQYYRMTPHGINQREADIGKTFRRFLENAVVCKPDLMVLAGDIFHKVIPGNNAVVECFTQLSDVQHANPDLQMVIVAGNHDVARTAETGSIFPLFKRIPRVHVAWRTTGTLFLPAFGLRLVAVPHAALNAGEPFAPDPAYRRNVLVIHGASSGARQWHDADWGPSHERGVVNLDTALKAVDGWSYIALGDYHVARQLAPNAWYSGSLDFCSSNPWGEIQEATASKLPSYKGWLLVDLPDSGPPQVTFQALPTARPYVDLGELESDGDATRVNEALHSLLPLEVAGKVVRLRVLNLSRVARKQLDYAHIKLLKSRALHFNLDIRPPSKRLILPMDVVDRCRRCDQPYVDADGRCAACGACGYCRGTGDLEGKPCLSCYDDERNLPVKDPDEAFIAQALQYVYDHKDEDPYQ